MTVTGQAFRGLWASVSERRHALHGLAVLRVAYGVLVLGVLGANLGDWQHLWGPASPWRPLDARAAAAERGTGSLLLLLDGPLWSLWLLVTLAAGALAMVLGWRCRLAVPVVAVLWRSLYERNEFALNAGDTMTAVVLVYACFADTGAVWSLDALRRRRHGGGRGGGSGGARAGETDVAAGSPASPTSPTSPWWRVVTIVHNGAVAAVVAQVVLVYVASAVFKLQGSIWRDGTAVYWALRPSGTSPFPWLSRLVWEHSWLVALVTYGTLVLQLVFPLALLHRWTRRVILLATTGMHLSIAVLLGLPAFSLSMLAAESVLVRDSGWRSLAAWLRGAQRSSWAR